MIDYEYYDAEMESLIAGNKEDFDRVDIEEREDQILVAELRHVMISSENARFEYKGKPKEKPVPVYIEGHKTYPRDRQTAIHAVIAITKYIMGKMRMFS